MACPQCGANVVWDPANPHRPFCSARCKTIDLGAWATESYRIPVTEDNDTPDDDASASEPKEGRLRRET